MAVSIAKTTTTFGIRRGAPVEVIIDGAHLYGVCRTLGFAIDFESLRNILMEEYDCRRISYVLKVAYNEEGMIQQPAIATLLDFLRYNGYTTVLGDLREWTDGNTGRHHMNKSVDVALTCAMMRAAQRVNDIILFAGSEDLAVAVEECINGERPTRVTLSSYKGACSHELRGTCDWFVDLLQYKDRIIRTPIEGYGERNGRVADQEPAEAVILQDRRNNDNSIGGRMRLHPRSQQFTDLT
jgi:uncharacterized LabA/DUF88 family protein